MVENMDTSLYSEPDYLANDAKDQLPVVSKIGRGPRGRGIFTQVVEEDGMYIIKILDDCTGETVAQTPNMAVPVITVKPSVPSDQLVPGEIAHADVTITQGGKTTTYVIDLPPGADGADVHAARGITERRDDSTYIMNPSSIAGKKSIRVNDVVVFYTEKDGFIYLSTGIVTAVDGDSLVVAATEYAELSLTSIGENGNWFIGDVDTGVAAMMEVLAGTTETVSPTLPASVTTERTDADTTTLNFKIPKGATFTPATDGTNLSWTNDGGMDNPDTIRVRATEYTPHMDVNTGELSWTNDGGKPNPATKNLTGPTIKIMAGEYREPGSVKELPDLPAFADTDEGTAYVVDDDAIDGQYDLYIHGSGGTDWTVVNNWAGVPGPAGKDGIGVVTELNGSDVLDRSVYASESRTIRSPVSAESLEGTSIAPLGQNATARISSAGAIANGSFGEIHGAIGAIGTCPSTPVPFDGEWNKNVWLTSIQDQVNDYIHGSRNENDLDFPMGSKGFPLAAEAAYGLIGTCLGAGRELEGPTDCRTFTNSGVWYVPIPELMLDNPVPNDPITGKLLVDRDDYGIHQTFIDVSAVVYTRHAGTILTDYDYDVFSPWLEVGLKDFPKKYAVPNSLVTAASWSLLGSLTVLSPNSISGSIVVKNFACSPSTSTNVFTLDPSIRPAFTHSVAASVSNYTPPVRATIRSNGVVSIDSGVTLGAADVSILLCY